MRIPFIIILLIAFVQSHGQILSGIVYDQNKPLAGATVQVRNGPGTKTDSAGKFSIKAPVPAFLVVSHIGYRTSEIKVTDAKPLKIILEPTTVTISEVTVSTGYQQIPKERSTGSFFLIDNKLFNEQVTTGITDRLEAIANSVSVDRKSNGGGIMIRGLSTIRGPRSPLVILDNFPYAGDIANLNPNDVESITILRDAAAASIWGAKAGNGVIVITTRKGKFGDKLHLSLSSNITIGNEPDIFYLPQMSSGDFIDVEQFLFSKGYKFSDTSNSSHPAFSPVYEILFKQRNGQLSTATATSKIDSLRGNDVRNDFKKYFYRKSFNRQYSLNLHGGSENISWILSAGLENDLSSLSAYFDRINGKFDNTVKVTKDLEVSSGFWFTDSRTANGKPAYGTVFSKPGSLFPYASFADADGNPLAMTKDYRQGYIDTTGAGKLLDWKYYPLLDYTHVNTATSQQDITAYSGFDLRISKFLHASLKYQYEKQQSDNSALYDADSYFTRDLINRFSQLNRSTGNVAYKIPKGGILDLNEGTLTASNLRGQFNFSKVYNSHSITAIAGAEISDTRTKSNGYRTYGYNSDILTSTNVDYANTYPSYITGSSAFIPNNVSFNDRDNRFASFFGNLAYAFKGRYTLTGSARKDGSNLFGVNTNDKWNPLWSAGAGWNISQEKFYRVSFLPFFKLRVTYGYSGNIDPSMSAVTTISYQATSPYTLGPYAEVRNFYNPELRWEKTGMLNAGIDFRTARNRISGSVEWYRKNSSDLFASTPVDYTTGLGNNVITRNSGAMIAHGMDIELHTINIEGNIKWTSDLNASFYKDRVMKYYLVAVQGNTFVNYGEGFAGLEGKPVYSVFSYRWAGLDPQTGDPQGYLNGLVSKDYNSIANAPVSDMVYNGPLFPTAFGSFGNTLSWHHLSLTIRLLYKLGYYFRKPSIDYSNLFGSWAGNPDYAKRWQKPGDELTTQVPSMVYPLISGRDGFYDGAEVLVDKGDNIRLQYVNASYEVAKSGIRKLPFSRLRFYIVASNLGLLWRANKDGIDPDYKGSSIPLPKAFAFGINADF